MTYDSKVGKMKNKSALYCLTILAVITLSSVSSAYAASKPVGTSLTASITATGSMENHKTYDWTLTKTMTPTEVTLKPSETSHIDATITATRQLTTETNVYGASGTVTVTNSGDTATENLQITVTVQYKTDSGQYQDLAGASTAITITSQLQAGKTGNYQYNITYTPVTNAQYKIVADVKITNHSGHMGTLWGPEPKTDYTLPSQPTTYITVDANAQLTDETICPEGFSYTSTATGTWHLTDSTTIHYTIDLTNNAAQPEKIYTLQNTATLTEETTNQQHTATALVTVHPSLFQVPEYWLGGLGALIALTVAFAVSKLTGPKKPNQPT
jgi:hypothetical protein